MATAGCIRSPGGGCVVGRSPTTELTAPRARSPRTGQRNRQLLAVCDQRMPFSSWMSAVQPSCSRLGHQPTSRGIDHRLAVTDAFTERPHPELTAAPAPGGGATPGPCASSAGYRDPGGVRKAGSPPGVPRQGCYITSFQTIPRAERPMATRYGRLRMGSQNRILHHGAQGIASVSRAVAPRHA